MEVNIFILFGLGEIIMILLIACIVLFLKVRKYRPYYLHNASPKDLFRKYMQKAIDDTRKYAKSINDKAESGDDHAVKQRKYMVARLNWLVIERDYLSPDKPDNTYWVHLGKAINKLLERWEMIDFIEAPPDVKVIETALAKNEADIAEDTDNEASDGNEEEDGDDQEKDIMELIGKDHLTEKEIAALKKQVRNLASYKSLYFSQQGAYRDMVDAYKSLKSSLNDLELEAGNAEKLRSLLDSHEQNEVNMSVQLEEMEAQQKRLEAELEQLEAIVNMQLDEVASAPEEAPKAPAEESEDMNHFHEMIEAQNRHILELKAKFNSLKVDPDDRIAIEEILDNVEKSAGEMVTCLEMMELEKERLNEALSSFNTSEA